MASAIGGTTLHSGANLPRPGDKVAQKLSHSDVDNLFLQNQALRWVLVDEVSMIPDELLGSFESHFRDAARQTRYKHRKDRSPRMFGGYNIICFGTGGSYRQFLTLRRCSTPQLGGEAKQPKLS